MRVLYAPSPAVIVNVKRMDMICNYHSRKKRHIMKESYDTVKLLADSGPEFAGVLPAEANKDSFCRMRDIMHVKDCNGISPMLYCNYSCITC